MPSRPAAVAALFMVLALLAACSGDDLGRTAYRSAEQSCRLNPRYCSVLPQQ